MTRGASKTVRCPPMALYQSSTILRALRLLLTLKRHRIVAFSRQLSSVVHSQRLRVLPIDRRRRSLAWDGRVFQEPVRSEQSLYLTGNCSRVSSGFEEQEICTGCGKNVRRRRLLQRFPAAALMSCLRLRNLISR